MLAAATPTPESDPLMPGTRPEFFGWWIVGSTFAVGFLVTGGLFHAFGVLVKPISASLNVGRAELSAVISLQVIVGALLSPWVGSMIATRSIRGIMLTGALALILGLTIASFADSLWLLWLVPALLSTAIGLADSVVQGDE